jgi:hypothetical protein
LVISGLFVGLAFQPDAGRIGPDGVKLGKPDLPGPTPAPLRELPPDLGLGLPSFRLVTPSSKPLSVTHDLNRIYGLDGK